MVSLKGVLFGLGLSFLGTIIYLSFVIRMILRHAPVVPSGGSIGIDVVTLFRTSLLHNPAYWLFALSLFAAGCAVVSLWQQTTI